MLVIGIAGGSGSGKTTVVKAISDNIKGEKVVIIPQDSYYKDSSDLTDEEKRHHNFDHPDAIDWDLLKLYCFDHDHLMKTLIDTIQNIPGIGKTETLVSLDQAIERQVWVKDYDYVKAPAQPVQKKK